MTEREQQQQIELQITKKHLSHQLNRLIHEVRATVKTAEEETKNAFEHTKERLSPPRYVRKYPVAATLAASVIGYLIAPRLAGVASARSALRASARVKNHSIREAAIGLLLQLSLNAGRRFLASHRQERREEPEIPTLRVIRGR